MFKVIPLNPASSVCYQLLSCNRLHRRFLQQNHYDVLELPQNCSSKQIREAFIRLSKKSHPDVNRNDPRCKEHFVQVNEAYNTLIKPCSRLEYDTSLKQRSTNPFYRYASAHYSDTSSRAWQDPSFYKNRYHSKNTYYRERPYYGVKGVKRMSNTVFVFFLIGFTAIGVGLQVLAIMSSHTMSRAEMIRRSQEYSDYHTKIMERRQEYGSREQQIEEFERRVNK